MVSISLVADPSCKAAFSTDLNLRLSGANIVKPGEVDTASMDLNVLLGSSIMNTQPGEKPTAGRALFAIGILEHIFNSNMQKSRGANDKKICHSFFTSLTLSQHKMNKYLTFRRHTSFPPLDDPFWILRLRRQVEHCPQSRLRQSEHLLHLYFRISRGVKQPSPIL
mmetsp:Transcript_54141/g.162089  ORF Transcript_54141/g.162089 Transcript_54141/m.162089 type:complete len:166 (-) Transcript_54141:2460-2957(-)